MNEIIKILNSMFWLAQFIIYNLFMNFIIVNRSSKNILSEKYESNIKNKKDIFWGFKLSDKQGKKTFEGDYVCFYYNGEINEIMKITKIEINEEKSLEAWKTTVYKKIVHLEKVKKCSMKWERVRELLGYSKYLRGLRNSKYINTIDSVHKKFMLELGLGIETETEIQKEKERNILVSIEKNTVVGQIGEIKVFKMLKEKGYEVKHSSIEQKFERYDIKYRNKNDKKWTYVEVKSTSLKNMESFYISSQEYEFYKKNKGNYKLYLVENIVVEKTITGKFEEVKESKNRNEIKLMEPSEILVKKAMIPTKWNVKV